MIFVIIPELIVSLSKDDGNQIKDLLKFKATTLQIGLNQQTYNLDAVVKLGNLELSMAREDEILSIIYTPLSIYKGEYLLTVEFSQVILL